METGDICDQHCDVWVLGGWTPCRNDPSPGIIAVDSIPWCMAVVNQVYCEGLLGLQLTIFTILSASVALDGQRKSLFIGVLSVEGFNVCGLTNLFAPSQGFALSALDSQGRVYQLMYSDQVLYSKLSWCQMQWSYFQPVAVHDQVALTHQRNIMKVK